MVLVDGKKIAADISTSVQTRVAAFLTSPRLTVITCNPNFETQKYLALKKAKAEVMGIHLNVEVLPETADTQTLIEAVRQAALVAEGIVVQLPLPVGIDTQAVLQTVPPSHDVDAFLYQTEGSPVLPPVVGAIDVISQLHGVSWLDKQVVIFGSGRLVGGPAYTYASSRGANVSVITEETESVEMITQTADIIILGVGKPNLLTPDMVKPGVVIFDAGASEDGGLLVGDADPRVAEKASLYTPVPGGIGPITVALLFRNLLDLQKRQ
jgi:methylenetetrahydrofolate dehydrogenase (NADP+)/methenyltetrahydrofolate cyclohydrolase